jgi:hypothetical protein
MRWFYVIRRAQHFLFGVPQIFCDAAKSGGGMLASRRAIVTI